MQHLDLDKLTEFAAADFVNNVNYGYTLKEIAELLGIHYATVSRAVRKVEQKK